MSTDTASNQPLARSRPEPLADRWNNRGLCDSSRFNLVYANWCALGSYYRWHYCGLYHDGLVARGHQRSLRRALTHVSCQDGTSVWHAAIYCFGGDGFFSRFSGHISIPVCRSSATSLARGQMAILRPLAPLISMLNTLLLLTSSLTVTIAHHAILENDNKRVVNWTGITVLLGIVFLGVQVYEYVILPFGLSDGIYPSTSILPRASMGCPRICRDGFFDSVLF